ncbi:MULTISPECIES: LysR family transcriptional regulator [unclassified Streptomyces]|uniref:LysR family transcriptional regulator n=1 Tax=unclassified Streptomyces TaxID=2593676 RepID=UPI0033BBB4F1
MALDLNLLVPLDALLQECSVTRAAQRLGLSQPTVSAALARLRRHFGDELLIRVGNSYELTLLAERLAPQVKRTVDSANRVFRTRSDFEPAVAEREFTLMVSDVQLATFGRVLTTLVDQAAPGVKLRFQHTSPHFVRGAQEHLRIVDGMVLPQGMLANAPAIDLYEDRWACVVASDTVTPTPPTPEELAARPWVMPYYFPSFGFSPLHELHTHGIEPRVEIAIENFLTMPHLIAGTDRVGMVPGNAIRLFPPDSGIVAVELPLCSGRLVESLWWHPLHEHDPAHTWLRRTAAEAGRLVTASTARTAPAGPPHS